MLFSNPSKVRSFSAVGLGLLFLFSGLLVVPNSGAHATGVDYLEGFEDDPDYGLPTAQDGMYSSFDTFGTGSFFVDPTVNNTGAKSLKIKPTSTGVTDRATFTLNGLDACDAASLNFSFRSDDTKQIVLSFGSTDASVPVYYMQVRLTTGLLEARISATGGSALATLKSGIAANTWLNITIVDIDCANAAATFIVEGEDPVRVDSGGAVATLAYFVVSGNGANFQNNAVWLDNLALHGMPAAAAPVVGAAETVSLGGIISGDVSPDGNTVIVRRGAPTSAVETYQAYNLTNQIGADNGSFCNRLGGVSATNAYMIYTGCSVSADTVDRIYVRDPDLVTATVQGCQTCPDTIATGGAFDVADFMNDVYSSSLFGLGSGSGNEEISMVFGYTTSTGRIGVAGYMVNQNGVDDDDFAEVAYGSGSPSDSCFTILSDGTKIIGAVSSTQATKFYSVQSERNALAGLPDTITVGLSLYLSNTGTYGQGNAIACLGDFALISSGSQVYLVNLLTKAVVGAPIAEAAQQRGLAINQDGGFAAIATGPDVQIYNLTSRLPVASFAYPTGNFKSIDMDGPGANAWVFMNGTIARFAVADQTCGTACEDATTGTPGIPTATGGFSSDVKANTAAALGISEGSAGAMATLLIMVIDASFFAVPVYLASKNAMLTMWAGYAGAVGGLVLAFAVDLAPAWLVTLMGVLLVATAVLMVYLGARR